MANVLHTSTNSIHPMAKSRESLVQGKIADLTVCSICAEIFTQPKILPCVHTFCLHCLETYGREKQPGDFPSCPICRSNFAIPAGGLCNLPNNFFIKEMVDIGKLAMTPVNEAKCNICPEGQEFEGKRYCTDCEQILCESCSKSHKKIKHCQNHQVVELGSRLKDQEFKARNSYCEDHPKQLITMYCTEHSVAICVICGFESHQSHKCMNVEKVAGNFTERLKEDLKKVTSRLPECSGVEKKLDKYKKEFLEEISKAEKEIFEAGAKLKMIVDEHTGSLVQKLRLMKEENLKVFEITKEEIERFRVMIDSFSGYSEELISGGSSVDICRAADQLHSRANELEKLPVNCSGGRFSCDTVAYQPLGFDNLLNYRRVSDAVGKLTFIKSPDRIIEFKCENTAGLHSEIVNTEIIQINVRVDGEPSIIVTLRSNAEVDELFRIVIQKCNIGLKPKDIYFVYQDGQLEYNSGKTLQDCKIGHCSIVTLMVRLRA